MFGNHTEGDAGDAPTRELHPLGTLGFHSPSITPAGDRYPPEVLAREYRNGIRAIGQLLERDNRGPGFDWFPKRLLIEALKIAGSDSFYFVDILGKVIEAEIDLFNYRTPTGLTGQMLESACLAKTWTRAEARMVRPVVITDEVAQRLRANPHDDTPLIELQNKITSTSTRPISFSNGQHRSVFRNFGPEGGFICVVDVYKTDDLHFIMITFGDSLNDSTIPKSDALAKQVKNSKIVATQLKRKLLPDDAGEPLWYIYGPLTKLRDITK
jgi:hypothetical protein